MQTVFDPSDSEDVLIQDENSFKFHLEEEVQEAAVVEGTATDDDDSYVVEEVTSDEEEDTNVNQGDKSPPKKKPATTHNQGVKAPNKTRLQVNRNAYAQVDDKFADHKALLCHLKILCTLLLSIVSKRNYTSHHIT